MDKPKRQRATESQLQGRISKALAYVRIGYLPSKIAQLLVEDEGISLRTAERAVKAALDMIDALGSQSTIRQRGKLLARLDHLYTATIIGNDKNLEQAIKVLNIEAKLLPKTESPRSETGEKHHEPTEQAASAEATFSPGLQQVLRQLTQNHPMQPELPDTGPNN